LTTALAVSGGHIPGFHCPFRTLTGIPCPTCFLTRATATALQGNLVEAVQLHLFGPAVAALLLVWSARGIMKGRLVHPPLPGPGLVVAAPTLMLYWLLRLVAHYGVGLPAFPGQ
jgi:hypothetical protein